MIPISSVFIYITFFVISFFVGHIGNFTIEPLQNKNTVIKVGSKIVFGFIVVTALFSIYTTFFQTVSTLLVVPAMLFFLNAYKSKKLFRIESLSRSELKTLGFFICVSLIILIFQFFKQSSPSGFQFSFTDFNFYASLSDSMVESHKETIYSGQANFYDNLELVPYHYFEMWLNGIFNQLSHTSSMLNYVYLTIPFLITLQFFSFYSFALYLGVSKFWGFLFSFGLIFNILTAPFLDTPYVQESLWYFQKSWASFILLPILTMLMTDKNLILSIGILLLFPVFNFAFIPVVGIFLIFYTIYLLVKKKEIPYPIYIFYAFCILIIIYYKLVQPNATSFPINFNKILSLSYLRTLLIFLYLGIKNSIIYSLFLLVIIALRLFQKEKPSVILNESIIPILFLISGVCSSSILNFHPESFHFTSISLLPAIGLIALINISKLSFENHLTQGVCVFALTIHLGYSIFITITRHPFQGSYFAANEISTLKTKINNNKIYYGGIIKDPYDPTNYTTAEYLYVSLGNPMVLVTDKNFSTIINTPHIAEIDGENLMPSPIYKFTVSERAKFKDISDSEIQEKFILAKGINYILTSNYKPIPLHLKYLINDSVVFKNGYGIFFLNQNIGK